ncbi:hypothetical protein DSL64_07320 [Dyadobacter luteus]|jgi:hypothetical protein|uniref:Outer membrane protein beta-barrel domain-containing protein n=1 Tax=Dyadobacter luteus TaxID=2259619 RepID=A0A3D8YET4_9BACT|nr:hypothetical protein [Dyadobacter luteus]REA62725.1 hypothetical protein DSL64_07320 [Dyadobacter luteus]
MKNKLLLCFTLAFAHVGIQAQDVADTTTSKTYNSGFAVYAEIGVLRNNSFSGIRDRMRELNIRPFESVMTSIVLAKRRETDKFYMEHRLILANSTKYNRDKDMPRSMFRGIGIGVDASPKFVNTKRWNVLVPLGWDLMLYQLRIKNDQSASLSQVIQNPGQFKSMRLYNGSLNLHGGVGVDYKMNFLPRIHDKVYISAKATYHLPVLRRGLWRGEDVTVNDLPSFRANQLYAQLGLVFFPKGSRKVWRGMHR